MFFVFVLHAWRFCCFFCTFRCFCHFFCTCCCFCRVCANQLEPQANKNLQESTKPTRTCNKLQKHINSHRYSTNVHTTQQYLVEAEGNPACKTSLRASGHPAIWGGGQRARPKAIEVRGQGNIFESCFNGGWMCLGFVDVLDLCFCCCFVLL